MHTRSLCTFLLALLFTHQVSAQVSPEAGAAFRFDGFSSYVDTRVTEHIKYFTVMAWVRSPNAPIFAQSNGPVHYENNFQFNWNHVQASNQGNVLMKDSLGRYGVATFGPLEADLWYHLAATYDGDTLRSYKNGRPIAKQGGLTGPAKQELNGTLKLGRHATLDNTYNHFEGDVDEVRIYKQALPADSIAVQMHHPVGAGAAGLAYYYQCNEARTDSTLNAATGRSGAKLIGQPARVASTAPFGAGKSLIVAHNAQGMLNAPGILRAYLPVAPARPAARFIATRIDAVAPLLLDAGIGGPPDPDSLYRDSYWMLDTLTSSAPNLDSLALFTLARPLRARAALYGGLIGETVAYNLRRTTLARTSAMGPVFAGAAAGLGYGTFVLTNYASLTTSNRPKIVAKWYVSYSHAGAQLHLPPGAYSLTLRTVGGQVIEHTQAITARAGEAVMLPRRDLKAGLYLVQLEGATGPQVLKWVVQ